MNSCVLLTGTELRHTFVRKFMAFESGISVLRTYCEGTENNLTNFVANQQVQNDPRLQHLAARELSEHKFFSAIVDSTPDHSGPVYLPKGEVNNPARVKDIYNLKPCLLVAYGCSLIQHPLLSLFKGRFLNVHLGLSPYYRGSGTNFWPMVNNRLEYVGATFMHIAAGIDTGDIIHQIRAQVRPEDSPHEIGNRLIRDMALVYSEIIRRFHQLEPMVQIPVPDNGHVYRKKDFTEDAVAIIQRNFEEGIVDRYLISAEERCAAVPIIENPLIRSVSKLKKGET